MNGVLGETAAVRRLFQRVLAEAGSRRSATGIVVAGPHVEYDARAGVIPLAMRSSRPTHLLRRRGADRIAPPLRRLARCGIATRDDGALVRALELRPLAPELLDGDEALALERTFVELVEGLRAGAAVQLLVERGERNALHLLLATPPRADRRVADAADAELDALLDVEATRALLRDVAIESHLLDGTALARLLLGRCGGDDGCAAAARIELAGSFDARAERAAAEAAANALVAPLAQAVTVADARQVRVGDALEQVVRLATAPDDDAPLGWVARTLAETPGVCASVCARRATTEHDEQLLLSVHAAVREPGPGARAAALAARVDVVTRLFGDASGASVQRGEFVQHLLWPATLPLALYPSGSAQRVTPELAARALAPLTAGCGSPSGAPLAHAELHGSLELLDPWDPAHRFPAVLVVGAGAAAVAATVAERLAALDGVRALAPANDLHAADAALAHAPAEGVLPLGELPALAEGDGRALVALARRARVRRVALVASLERPSQVAAAAGPSAAAAFPIVLLLEPADGEPAAPPWLPLQAGELQAADALRPLRGPARPTLWLNGGRGRGRVRLNLTPLAVETPPAGVLSTQAA